MFFFATTNQTDKMSCWLFVLEPGIIGVYNLAICMKRPENEIILLEKN